MEEIIKIAYEFGPLGLVVLACFYYIIRKDKQHREERVNYLQTMNKLSNKQAKQDKNQQDSLVDLIGKSIAQFTRILGELDDIKDSLKSKKD